MPRPVYSCLETTPTYNTTNIPPGEILLTFAAPAPGDPPGEFIGIRGKFDGPGGVWQFPPVTHIAFNEILVTELRPEYYYEWYWYGSFDACGDPSHTCISWFYTGEETPTPTPPTPTPLPGDGWYLSQNNTQGDDRSSAEVRR